MPTARSSLASGPRRRPCLKAASLVGEVYATDMHGAYKLLHVSLSGDDILHIRADRMVHYPIGAPVRFDIRLDMERFFDPRTQQAIFAREEAAR